jgi:hypothetical protein
VKAGDLVEVCKRSSWGGVTPTGKTGLVLRRTYLAYDNGLSQWDVHVNGRLGNYQERNLRVR